MSLVDGPTPIVKQPLTPLQKLRVCLGLIDNDLHDGEVLTGVRAAKKLLRGLGIDWRDLVDSYERAVVVEAANTELVAELNTKKQRIAELEAERSRGTTVALWNSVPQRGHSRNRVLAAWVLDLHRQRRVYLSASEIAFLTDSVPTWRGELRPKQAAWLTLIIERCVDRTGLTPPIS